MPEKHRKRDVTTVFAYSHLNTPIDQWECMYCLEYFINNDILWYQFLKVPGCRTSKKRSQCKMETWLWILGWLLSILTMTGNGFIVFLVCRKRQLRTKTNAFVVSLAVADFCVGMSVVPPMFLCQMATGCNPRPYWISFVRWVFGYQSVVNLCVLVLDRYIAVVKPLKYLTVITRRRVIQTISLSWGFQVAHSIIWALNSRIFEVSLVSDIQLWFDVIFLEFLPCLVLLLCFASMLHAVFKHDRASRIIAKQLRFNHSVLFKPQEKSAIKLMALVIAVFLLCYGLFICCTLVYIFESGKCNDEEYKIPLLVLNSAINPVAYAFFKRDIKKEIKQRIFCHIRKLWNSKLLRTHATIVCVLKTPVGMILSIAGVKIWHLSLAI